MSLWRKELVIGFCQTCGSYGVPLEEKVYDPLSQKNYYVCRDCFTAHAEIDLSYNIVVDGQKWSEKHQIKDRILNVPFKGGK